MRREIARAGADTFVAGSAIFGSRDYAATIRARMRAAKQRLRYEGRQTQRGGLIALFVVLVVVLIIVVIVRLGARALAGGGCPRRLSPERSAGASSPSGAH